MNSCLIGANVYCINSAEEEFHSAVVEEITDAIRQEKGRSYMRANTLLDESELWMVPFHIGKDKLRKLQQTMEYIFQQTLGLRGFHFPLDIVLEDGQTAYLMHPIDRQKTTPIRTFMPDAFAPRWKIAASLFQRVLKLKQLGLTSNGISREQLRVQKETGEVQLWLNETVAFVQGSEYPENTLRHKGFMALPIATEKACSKLGIGINGTQRDIFSAAVAAFYLILYTHPFIGSGFHGLLREDYLTNYQHFPMYVMLDDPQNNLGNQMFGRVVEGQWKRTVPQLRELFDGLFKAVTNPAEHWKQNAPYWEPQNWLNALALDAQANDNEASWSDFHFRNEQYHQV